jgi:uncharacterized protein DUF5367
MTRYAITGFIIWAAATIALRLGGHYVLRFPVLLFIVSVPAMVFVAIAVVGSAQDRARAAIALVAPGMLLDTISTIGFARVFPNIAASAAGLFGGWLLLCNVVVLLTAVTYAPRRVESQDAASLCRNGFAQTGSPPAPQGPPPSRTGSNAEAIAQDDRVGRSPIH